MSLQPQQTEFFLKVVLIGSPGVGKTSILERFVEDKFSQDYKATIGADFKTKDININNKTILLQIWDTAGQERFRALAAPFYRGADICVLVFDVSQKITFEAIQQWKDEFLRHAGITDSERFPFLLLGNKTDLGVKVTKKEVYNWIKNNKVNMEYIETSALKNTNIQNAFETVGKLCLDEFEYTQTINNSISFHQMSKSQISVKYSESNITLESIFSKEEDYKNTSNCFGEYCQLL